MCIFNNIHLLNMRTVCVTRILQESDKPREKPEPEQEVQRNKNLSYTPVKINHKAFCDYNKG